MAEKRSAMFEVPLNMGILQTISKSLVATLSVYFEPAPRSYLTLIIPDDEVLELLQRELRLIDAEGGMPEDPQKVRAACRRGLRRNLPGDPTSVVSLYPSREISHETNNLMRGLPSKLERAYGER